MKFDPNNHGEIGAQGRGGKSATRDDPAARSSKSPLSRRNFLVAALAVPVVATAAAAPALAVEEHDQFAAAATKYGVPASVLAAISYGQTRWEDHAGRPSTSLGYGPMHLVDGAAAQAQRDAAAGKSAGHVIDTLGRAATLTGRSKDTLRADTAANIMGAAAVLASAQQKLGHPVGANTDPATWYEAVATTCGFTTASSQRGFADDVVSDLRAGVARKASGVELKLKATKVGSVTQQRSVITKRVETAAKKAKPAPYPIDAPKNLAVDWVPAPYEKLGDDPGDYGNHDLGRRPVSPALNTIVIHDMECPYDEALELNSDPTYLAWNYSVRSSDGQMAQHLEAADIGWHAGNWYVNSHSIGVEHEGYAVNGPTWFTEVMYRKSARLIRYLCDEYKIPVDRAHIIGHDQVPATTTAGIKSMHWDPGPFWDWEHYFELLKAPLTAGTRIKKNLAVGDIIRILPGFDGNEQTVTGCDTNDPPLCVVDGPQPATNFVALHVQPDEGAPLVKDIGMHPDGGDSTTKPDDVSARANAGTDFVVAGVYGDWTAIWYLGQKSWFHNPAKKPTARLVKKGVKAVPKAGNDIQVYGKAYPEASAYTDPDDVQEVTAFSYVWGAGQEYVIADQDVPTDYYKAKTYDVTTANDHIDIVGQTKYYLVYFGHRVMYVQAKDVKLT